MKTSRLWNTSGNIPAVPDILIARGFASYVGWSLRTLVGQKGGDR